MLFHSENKKNQNIQIFFHLSSLSLTKQRDTLKKLFRHILLPFLLFAFACEQAPINKSTKVIIREKTDASTLNPVAASDPVSAYTGMHLFQTLTNIDYKTEKTVGLLATSPPKITYDSSGTMMAQFELRENASFSKNEKVTLDDILFSLKVNLYPLVENSDGANYYNFIETFTTIDDRSFTITCTAGSVLNELRSGDFAILPKKHYDNLNRLQNFNIHCLKTDTNITKNDSIRRFAESFNASLTSIKPSAFKGSGPYVLKKWQKGERIILERKTDWWGDALKDENTFFKANATILQFEIINDNQTAVNALKAGEIDVLNFVSQSDFEKIENSENISTLECKQHGYSYIGFNCNHPILQDRSFRKVIEAAIPYQKIIDIVFQNQAELNRVPLALQQIELRNNKIEFEGQNLEKAKAMLTDLNWEDADNNGIVEKLIDGKTTECRLQFHYNAGNEERKAVGFLLKNELAKIGISLEIKELEWKTYLKALRNNEVDLFMSAKLTMPITPDFTSSLHSSSANGGRNYANYQNPVLDRLIENILLKSNEKNRTELIKQAQIIIAEDSPYIYLLSTSSRFAHSNRLKNVPVYSIRPHFWAAELY